MKATVWKFSFILFFLYAIAACDKERENPVPNVTVSFQVNLDMPDANDLNFPQHSILVKNYGYQLHGVIVYNTGVDGYYAFDATCPNDLDQAVVLDSDNPFQATCPKCNRVYSFMAFGYPTSGGGYALKKYTVMPNGRLLFIYNGY